MILSHIKQIFDHLKTADGEYFIDIFNSTKEIRPEVRDRKFENKRDIVYKLTESIYLDLDPNFEEKVDKNVEKSQITIEKSKPSHATTPQMMMNFVETFKSKEQVYWSLEILGNVFLFVGDENIKPQGGSMDKIYEKGLEIYKVILLFLPKVGFRENQSLMKTEIMLYPVKLALDEDDKQKLFKLAISHLSLAFEKIENIKKADFLLKVVDVFNRYIILNPLIIKDDTWEFILFVLIGILDYIIQKRKKIDPKVLEELEHQLTMSLMNAWINSGMRDYSLWKKFSNYARSWQNVELFLNKWKEVCIGLTRKVLHDLYNLPFVKVKVDPSKDVVSSATKTNLDAASKQDYSAKAATFLLIVYEKPKQERTESLSNYNLNMYSKSQVFPENPESNQQLFWANISSEQTVFLWHKFLHLFERHPCETSGFQPNNTIKFCTLQLRTIQEIVNEILKVGHGISNQKLFSKESKDHSLTVKAIESIWAKAIQPRRIERTQCQDCAKKAGKSINYTNPDVIFKRGFIEQKSTCSEHENIKDADDMILMKSNSRAEIQRNSDTPIKEELGSKKEAFERDLKKNMAKQKSMRPTKSTNKDPLIKLKVLENNKYMFSKHKVAKGDDILGVFSKWLYECGSSTMTGHEELNLLAIQILAKIFRKARGPFKEEYLLKFYCLLLENIKKEEASGYLKICVKLFEVNLPNVYCLIKEFIMQFANKSLNSQPTKFLDIYSKFISRFVCCYLGRLKYIEEFEVKFEKYYYSLDFWINHVLECLKIWDKKEKSNCLITVNWVLSIHTVNNQRFNIVLNRIFTSCKENSKQSRLSSLQLMQLAFSIMLSVGEIYHLKRLRAEEGLSKEEMNDIKISLDFLFDEINSFVLKFGIQAKLRKSENSTIPSTSQIKEKDSEKEKEKENEVILNISFLILQCIYIWLTLPFSEITDNIYNYAVTLCVDIFQNTTFKKLNDYSSVILKNLMNNMGKSLNFQNTVLLSTAISSIDEPDLLNPKSIKPSIFDSFKYSQSVVINQEVIVTFYLGELSPNEDLVLCIRNSQGKFIWQGELIYKLFPNKDYEPFTDFETLPYKTNAEIYENLRFYWKNEDKEEEETVASMPNNKKSDISEDYRNRGESNSSEDVKKLTLDEMIQLEFELEEQFEQNLDSIEKNEQKNKNESNQSRLIKKQLEINSQTETRLLNITKLFLFHFGLLDIRNSSDMPNKTIFLDNSKELWDSLRDLDRMPERSQIEVNCFYINHLYQTEMNVPLVDEKNYREYTEFIESISCPLDETSFKTGMYESVKNLQRKYPILNYSSNMLFEIVYLQPQICDKQPKNLNICILWNARGNDDKWDNKLPSFLKIFLDDTPKRFIMITPMNTYLYSIKVFKITDIHEIKDIYVGPLISKMMVTKDCLPVLVNATILNIFRKQNVTPLMESQEQRKMKIDKIIDKFVNKERTENFLSILNLSQLLNKKDDFQNTNNPLLKSPSEKSDKSTASIKENSKQREIIMKKLEFIDEKRIKPAEKNDQFEFMINEENDNMGSNLNLGKK